MVLNNSISINVISNLKNYAPNNHSLMISLYDENKDTYYDWEIDTLEINGQNKKFDILNLKYFKLNSINNLNNTITWIDIDIDKFKNIEILQETTL